MCRTMEREKQDSLRSLRKAICVTGSLRKEFDEEKFMRTRVPGFLGLLLLAASVGIAHGNKIHVVGTIEKINPDSVVVKTVEGKSVEVKLVATTAYILRVEKTDKPAKAADLAVGQRVAIHAASHSTPTGETLEAEEIKFSPASSAHAAGPTATKPKS